MALRRKRSASARSERGSSSGRIRRPLRVRFEAWVAKNHSSLYRPNDRGWVKVKNPNYWRRDAEREALVRSQERWARGRGYASGASPS